MANRIYLEVGRRELRFIINFGFFFGALLGVPLVFLTQAVPHWWVLPIGGVIIGYVTNWVALWMIFEPVEPHRFGPLKVHGLFIRRQPRYQRSMARSSRRTSSRWEHRRRAPARPQLGPDAPDYRGVHAPRGRPGGRPRPAAVRVALGSGEYDTIRESVASEAVDYTMTPLTDPEFNRRQSAAMCDLITDRMRELPHEDFSELLRSAMREDEWLLLLHGAVLGFLAGASIC